MNQRKEDEGHEGEEWDAFEVITPLCRVQQHSAQLQLHRVYSRMHASLCRQSAGLSVLKHSEQIQLKRCKSKRTQTNTRLANSEIADNDFERGAGVRVFIHKR